MLRVPLPSGQCLQVRVPPGAVAGSLLLITDPTPTMPPTTPASAPPAPPASSRPSATAHERKAQLEEELAEAREYNRQALEARGQLTALLDTVRHHLYRVFHYMASLSGSEEERAKAGWAYWIDGLAGHVTRRDHSHCDACAECVVKPPGQLTYYLLTTTYYLLLTTY